MKNSGMRKIDKDSRVKPRIDLRMILTSTPSAVSSCLSAAVGWLGITVV